MTTTESSPVSMPEPDEPRPVDQIPNTPITAYTRITAAREGSKQPILVPWLRKAEERSAILGWAVGYAWHVLRFHAIRVPTVYQGRLLWRAPVGLYRTVRFVVNALVDAEAAPLRAHHVEQRESREYLALVKERNARIKRRTIIVSILLVPVLAAALWLVYFVGGLWMWISVLAVVNLFGVLGRSREVPLISKATTPAHLAPVLRQGAVEDALRAIGISALAKAERIEFPDPIIKDGPGWLARINLPLGVTPEQVMGRRAELASGLRRPLGCVWPESGSSEHGGLLRLFVSFTALAAMDTGTYPLVNGKADLFRPLPFGINNRGGKVKVGLFESNVLVGAIPGAGKTSVVRVLLCGAALDPTAELHVWELFGKGDLSCAEQVAHRYGSGLDTATLEACVADLREIRADIEVRAAALKKLTKEARELVPDAKTTRDVANRRHLGLYPKVIFLDEVQNLYQHETYGKEAERLVLDIIRMGRAVGVILVQSTQRPDANSLPKAISANAGIRIGLRMMGWLESDMILGSGMNQKGVTAAQFTRSDRGVAWLVGADDEPTVVKAHYLTTELAEKLCARARALRQAGDLLTGYASGELDLDPDDSLIYNLLADVRRVLAEAGASWAWSKDIVTGLAALRPAHYAGWSEELLARNLSPLGVTTRQLNRTGEDGVRRNLMGVELEQLEEPSKSNVVPLRVEPHGPTGRPAS